MTDRKLSDAEAMHLWRRAEHRLRLLDTEPPVALDRVDALLQVLGPRRQGESLGDWLLRSRTPQTAPVDRPSAEIIPFSPKFSAKRQRFTPVAEIVRLAADSAGSEVALPSRELETADGRFRLKVTSAGDQVLIEIQALGLAPTSSPAARSVWRRPTGHPSRSRCSSSTRMATAGSACPTAPSCARPCSSR